MEADAAGPTFDAETLKELRTQVEFWLGDDNLASDTYLRDAIGRDPAGYVPLRVFANFRKIRAFGATAADLSRAIAAAAPSALLELSPNGLSVRRIPPLPPPVDLNACKVVVYPVSATLESEDLIRLFSPCGKVFSASLLTGIATSDPSDKRIVVAAIARFVDPSGAAEALKTMPGMHGIAAAMPPERWFQQQRLLRAQRKINEKKKGATKAAAAAAAAEAEEEEEKEDSDVMDTATTSKEESGLPASRLPPKICVMGPVPVNTERKDVLPVLQSLAPSGVVVDLRKLKRSKFTEEDFDLLPKPLVDIHLRFLQESEARAAIAAADSGQLILAKRPVKIVPLTPEEIRDHYAPTIAEALEKAREMGRHPQRQQRAERRNVAKGVKRMRTQHHQVVQRDEDGEARPKRQK